MDAFETRRNSSSGRIGTVRLNDAAPPVAVPPGHIGPVVLPGSGRLIYWTGRVAIGLRHERPQRHDLVTSSALWVQDVMLSRRGELKAA
jgi:hypothetical protein